MTILAILSVIVGIFIISFFMLATYAALMMASHWDDIDEKNNERYYLHTGGD